ncbi:MAG TPA: class I SAM-dependent methyltransferase [Ktedonobacteraceae bacterium]|jgi:ubiquinone/menaquinone biosynthesis C-methylase UbiE|nr:class I SAM-dependent methyltransferase [Ktedonobacteraceae bacterium]
MGQQDTEQGPFVSGQFNSAAEVARITKRQQLMIDNVGGLFPERCGLSSIQRILDIACGPGIWALEVAFTYAQIEVVGIDPNRTNIRYAQAQAQAQNLENVDFQVMDALHGLDFSDHTFDLVNAQFIDDRVPISAWPTLLQSCLRVLRPGGVMRITISELIVTNSAAYEELLRLNMLALYKAGYGSSAHGYYSGTTAMLSHMLRQVGYQQVQQRAHVIDLSQGSKASQDNYASFAVLMQLIKPFLLKMEVVTEDRFDVLYREATINLLSDTYYGLWYFLTVWGEAPAGVM